MAYGGREHREGEISSAAREEREKGFAPVAVGVCVVLDTSAVVAVGVSMLCWNRLM